MRDKTQSKNKDPPESGPMRTPLSQGISNPMLAETEESMKMTPREYLNARSIEFKESGNELIFKCPFGDCDAETHHAGHLYMQSETGLYRCVKCDASGNLVTLARHFDDDPSDFEFMERPVHVSNILKKKVKQVVGTLVAADVEKWHAALPEKLKDWLTNERGLSPQTITEAKLGFDGERLTIPIPNEKGDWLFAKRRTMPGSSAEPRYLYPSGAQAALYGIEYLKGADYAVICEGELDALILRSKAITAVTSTGGAGTFDPSWTEVFKDIPALYIVYDNDDAGRKGALKVGKLLPRAKIVRLPSEVGDKGDVTDYFMKLSKTPDDFWALLQTGKTAPDIEEQGERHISLPKPSRTTTLGEWREKVMSRFPECLAAGEVGLAVIAQLAINDVRNPFGLVYVDVPSAGKTITLNFFSELDELVYSTDSFTPSSIVSHATNRKQEDLEKIDLLPRIRFKTVVVRDLAPIFAERQENLLKNLGVLTRVFDGEGYESDSGVHGKRGYRGDYTFMFLAASTPIAPRVWKFMGTLGSRLFFLNLNTGDKDEEELADLLIQNDFKLKEKECRSITRDTVLTLREKFPHGINWNKNGDPANLRQIISRCAKLLARLRGTLNVWGEEDGSDKGQNHTNVVIEKPIRINQLLYNLARGHAAISGRDQISEEDIWPVIEVTLNSAPYNRIKLIEGLIENHGTVNTKLVEWAIDCSNPTALKEIETLRVLGVVDVQNGPGGDPGRPEKIVTIKNDLDWFCSDDCARLRAMKPEGKTV